MLTAAAIRAVAGEGAAEEIFRALGYPVAPVVADPEEWRRGGIELPWNGKARLTLASRTAALDVFTLRGEASEEQLEQFLRSYARYNVLTTSIIAHNKRDRIAICDLGGGRRLRRLDVDLIAPSAQAVDRLNLLTFSNDRFPIAKILDRALGREHLTRQFFQRFRAAVAETSSALRDACPCEERSAADVESLLLLSRLLFLSFVQEKGWLNGERRFLVDRLERCVEEGREFFASTLIPLFFGCLNTPRGRRSTSARQLGMVPYLNGGLFEPSPFERRNADLHLPNGLMQRVIDGVFERFDFSIDENDSAGTHVDPEMLGKVFESLMEEDERAASGSFYTPRAIVDVLVGRALSAWLASAPEGTGDPKRVLRRLETIHVLDPACGSGAFLLSALGAIERLYREHANAAGEPVPNDLRASIVERSLFGVDVKAEAVRLCELRLWLAIVSETSCSAELIRPLPNLDRNILQGNSLLGPSDFLGDARRDLYAEWACALTAQRELIDRYRHADRSERPALSRAIRGNDQRLASELLAKAIEADERELARATAPARDLFGRARPLDRDYCRALHDRIARQRAELERVEEGDLDFFACDVHFAHVIGAGGFDLVVGNPPWVRNSRIDERARRMYADRFTLFRRGGAGAAFHQPDLSVAFFEKSLDLAKSGGVLALLMPSKIASASYAAPLRQAVSSRGSLLALHDWGEDAKRLFEADTFPLGVVLRKGGTGEPIEVMSEGTTFVLTPEQLGTGGAEWSLVPSEVSAVLSRVRAEHPTVAQSLGRSPLMGVKTGDNAVFFLDGVVRGARLLTAEGIAVPLTALCRCVRGRDVRRWRAEASRWMLWPPANGWRSAPQWLEALAASRGFEASSVRLSFVRPEHAGINVVWKDVSRGMAAAVVAESVTVGDRSVPLVANQTLYLLDAPTEDEAHALAAVLNSTVFDAMLLAVAERAKDAHCRCFGRTVAALALPRAFEAAAGELSRASRQLHAGRGDEEALDRLVCGLYEVSAAELEILRAFVRRRSGAR